MLSLITKTNQGPRCFQVVRVWSFVALLVDLNVTRLLATRSFLYKQKTFISNHTIW
jgi:hypothetical protein